MSEARLQAVSSRNMYSEQGFEAADLAVGRAGVPLVDGAVELEAGVGALPGGAGDLVPEVAGLDLLSSPCRRCGRSAPTRRRHARPS